MLLALLLIIGCAAATAAGAWTEKIQTHAQLLAYWLKPQLLLLLPLFVGKSVCAAAAVPLFCCR
jgi:hypothetical protein